jgi:hypothetical protein
VIEAGILNSIIYQDNLLPDDILDLPLHPDPPSPENGQLKSTLLKHQVRLSSLLINGFFILPLACLI